MSSTPTTDNQNAVNNTQDKCHRQDCKHGDQQENQREQCSLNESKPSSVLATTHVSQEQGRKTVDGVGESVEVAHQLQKEQVDTHDISKGHPVSAPVHAEDASCPVCYVNLISGHRAFPKECGHSFCYDCLLSWSKKASQLTCPLCQIVFSAIIVENGEKQIEEPVFAAPKSVADDHSNLGHLDHSYFRGEVERLMAIASYAIEDLNQYKRSSNSRFKSSSFHSLHDRRNYEELSLAMERLTSLKSGLVQIQPLDTVSILHMLDEIQQSVIKATQPPDYNQAEEDEGEYDDYYDDYDEEEEDGGYYYGGGGSTSAKGSKKKAVGRWGKH